MLRNADRLIGLLCVAFALAVLFIWIPLDVETGVLEKVRRRVEIGDAMAPSVAAIFIALSGLLLMLRGAASSPARLEMANWLYLVKALVIVAASFLVMRYAGPLLVGFLNTTGAELGEYRALRDTAPWKYVGYFLGGILLVAGMIGFVQHRLTLRAIIIAALVTAALAAIYDLPFDDLLLPPNGDV